MRQGTHLLGTTKMTLVFPDGSLITVQALGRTTECILTCTAAGLVVLMLPLRRARGLAEKIFGRQNLPNSLRAVMRGTYSHCGVGIPHCVYSEDLDGWQGGIPFQSHHLLQFNSFFLVIDTRLCNLFRFWHVAQYLVLVLKNLLGLNWALERTTFPRQQCQLTCIL